MCRWILLSAAFFAGILTSHAQLSPATLEFSHLAGANDGDDGARDAKGSAARFSALGGLTINSAGDCYVTEPSTHTIRKITPDGVVSTIGGSAGQSGFVNGDRATARFFRPMDVVVDGTGAMFVADSGNNAIRVISPEGNVTTLAGSSDAGNHDGGGTEARFNGPQALAIDRDGDVYVADEGNALVRKISRAGIVTTIPELSGHAGPPLFQPFEIPVALAVDAEGILYVGYQRYSAHSVWSGFAFKKRSPTGKITTIIQNVPTGSGYYGVTLGGMTVDHEGRILATDACLNRIIQIEPSGEERIVGGPADTLSPPGNLDAAGTAARFHEPRGIDVDASGNVHVADSANHAIRKGVPFARGSTTRLANISVRGRAGTAEETLILGFVIGSPDGKPILVRGVGPGLSSYGVPRALPDPNLQLYSGRIPVAGNDDWGGVSELRDLFALLGAAPLAANSKDAALSISLMRGVYTAHVTAADGETGIALAEVFDAEIGGAARVINLSARSQIGVGDDILIAGFVLAGSTPKTVLIRGAGPILTELGVTSAMKDPQIALFQGSARIVQNDDWSGADTLKSVFKEVGAFGFPFDASKDAAMLVTLQPGAYTVQLTGANNEIGVGLIEIYDVP